MRYRYFEEKVGTLSGESIFNRWDTENNCMHIRMLPPNDSGWEPDVLALTLEDMLDVILDPPVELTEEEMRERFDDI